MLKILRASRRWLLGVGVIILAHAATAQTSEGVTRAYPEHRTGLRCAFDSAQQAAFARQPGAEQVYKAFLREVAQMGPTPGATATRRACPATAA